MNNQILKAHALVAQKKLSSILTRKRIDDLKRHICFTSVHGGGCWKCRALKRYRADTEARKERGHGGGRKHRTKEAG